MDTKWSGSEMTRCRLAFQILTEGFAGQRETIGSKTFKIAGTNRYIFPDGAENSKRIFPEFSRVAKGILLPSRFLRVRKGLLREVPFRTRASSFYKTCISVKQNEENSIERKIPLKILLNSFRIKLIHEDFKKIRT